MIRVLFLAGCFLTALDLIVAAVMFFGRDGGDAATRGLGKGLGSMLAGMAFVAAALLLWGGREAGRPLAVILGSLVAAFPLTLSLALMVSRHGLGLIYPSMREPKREYRASPQYAFPDAASREAALALVMNDYAKLDTLLRASPAPDLKARDELGRSLLGLATRVAIMAGGRMEELEGLRLVLAAGARPQGDDFGREDSMMESLARSRSERELKALSMLLDAGLSPDTPVSDGRSVLFYRWLTPEVARMLLERGVRRDVHDTRGGAQDWSPVTYQADLDNWETALVLLEGGVPPDHGSPPGSVLDRVLKDVADRGRNQDAEKAYQAFLAALQQSP